MKKILVVLFFCVIIILCPLTNSVYGYTVYAEDSVEQELEEEIDKQITNLDLSQIESLIDSFTDKENLIWGSSSFWEKINSLIKGEYDDSDNLLQILIDIFFEELLRILPTMALIIAIAIVFSMFSLSQPNFKNITIKEIIHFVCYGAIIVIVLKSVFTLVTQTSEIISVIKLQMEAIFPVLLTIMASLGGNTMVAVYQPAFAIITGGVLGLFSKILLPLFICILVFSLLSNLTKTVKFEQFVSFFSSIYKWIIGIAFTVFYGFVAVKGISAGTYDNISIRTAKYAIKNSVPIVGGYLSDGINLVMASSVLIKNAIGVGGILLLISSIAIPLVNMLIYMFCLKLTSAILQPLSDSRIVNFLSTVSKTISLLIALVVAIVFMYILLVGLVMCSANIY